jgi:hypothetical protein
MAAAKQKTKSTMLTRNGKTRLGPLNIEQLEKLLSGARKKHVAMIQRRIAFMKSLPSYKAPAVVEEVVESAVEVVAE